uniref:hypothetical protein n=1 Tax=Salmonella sp. s55004 TaxID=3159675 RepID=UPI003980710E
FKFMTSEGSERAKIIFIHWSPDTVGVKEKMLYASSKDALKAVLADGIAVEVQANDISDLGYDEIVDRLKSSMSRS